MDTIGLDLHKRESQRCSLTSDGELIERRIATTRERFTEVLGGRPRARILAEDGTAPVIRQIRWGRTPTGDRPAG